MSGETRAVPICSTWLLCIQCGIYIKPPQTPWTVVIDDVKYAPIHNRCKNGFARRMAAYPPASPPPAVTGEVMADPRNVRTLVLLAELDELHARSAELRSVHCEIGDALAEFMPPADRVPSFVQRCVFAIARLRASGTADERLGEAARQFTDDDVAELIVAAEHDETFAPRDDYVSTYRDIAAKVTALRASLPSEREGQRDG